MKPEYLAQSARDAQNQNYGTPSYWEYLEDSALELHRYFMKRGQPAQAELMLTRSLAECLDGNEGE